eukprot:gnl/MRDRNA2_/MRDRNA2_78115_c0_seq1.p1 gnl/MRDRNA2_/MRDRNA2_78115_c0~~gnl/MRDRNA2_/MRDRNA2_78115_c0_seq1.p1  ORF type:complete len:367 (+),score=41.56 gnl/MRDRNA2_/MRDRNA2_78115_c0_seq1:117-1217(+)
MVSTSTKTTKANARSSHGNVNSMKAKAKATQGEGKIEKSFSQFYCSQFWKTRMCEFHQHGTCRDGSDCVFAHSEQELKPRPDLSCTRLCPVLVQTGRCTAKNCTYAHSTEEMISDACQKTKLCRFWPVGKCNLGNQCRFAHSADELREPAGTTGKQRQQGHQYSKQLQTSKNHAIAAQYQQFDTPSMYAPNHVIPQLPFLLMPVSICAYDHSWTLNGTCMPYSPAPQQSEDDSSQEGHGWIPPDKFVMYEKRYIVNEDPSQFDLHRGTSSSTQDSDGLKSCSALSDSSENEVEEPLKTMPSMWDLPLPLSRAQQPSAIMNDTGSIIDHYAEDVEIMQAHWPRITLPLHYMMRRCRMSFGRHLLSLR